MALFNKFFSTHKRKNATSSTSHQNSSQFPFSNEQVRILLYRECDWRGRRLLFDSTAVQKVNISASVSNNTTPDCKKYINFIDTVDGVSYRYTRPDEDFNGIGDMVFGSVSMSVRATTLKVHWLQGPTRVLCSQVFLSPLQSNTFSSNTLDANATADLNSVDTSSLNSFSLSVSVCVSDNLNNLGIEKQAQTNPLDVPPPASESSDGERSFAYSDSGYSDPWNASGSSYYPYNSSTRSSFGSVYSDREASRKFSTDSSMTDAATVGTAATAPSDGNMQRRIMRNMTTSFENRRSVSDSIGYIGDSQAHQAHSGYGLHVAAPGGSEGSVPRARRCSEQVESRSNPEMMRKRGASGDAVRSHHSSYGPGIRAAGKRPKLGLAICITLSESVEDDMQLFCSEHIMLLESMLCRLRATAENAYVNQKKFYQIMLHAWFSTTEWITDLFTAPRLIEPVWLALSSGYSQNPVHLAQCFMSELCWLLNCADTKDTNFFISRLLTAILTHHLGWVGTVAPLSISNISDAATSNANSTAAAAIAKQERAKMSEISKFHPYNVLWAQMGDLYGAIGNPPKLSKTIVCGTETQTVDKVLNVLTYFIRCGQIERDHKTEVFEKNVIDDILDNFVSCSSVRGDAGVASVGQNGFDVNDEGDLQFPRVKRPSGGLTRTATCIKDLTSLTGSDATDSQGIQEAVNGSFVVGTYQKKNDIPNVLIFRDSRFVKQELRIGNFLMDTGIEMNMKQKLDIQNYKVKSTTVDHIKLLVTSPENEEFAVNDADSNSSDDTVEEATESIETNCTYPSVTQAGSNLKSIPSLSDLITANSIGSASLLNGNSVGAFVKTAVTLQQNPSTFLWGIEPIKEGLSVEQWQHIEKGINLKLEMKNVNGNCFSDGNIESGSTSTGNSITEFKRSKSLYTKSSNVKNSDHIKKSKVGRKKSFNDFDGPPTQQLLMDGSTSNIENVDPAPNALKSYPSLSDLITANSVGVSERLTWGIEPVKETITLDEEQHFEFAKKMIAANTRRDPGVVFTLGGDNETLVNLKNSEARKKEAAAAVASSSTVPQSSTCATKKTCSHKKHSGVKFNFEKYPQIATNYMKNKNIDLAHYDFIEKGLKLEQQTTAPVSNGEFPLIGATETADDDENSSECECCAGNLSRILQTPSNATELEFSNDDNSYPTSTSIATSAVSTSTLSKKSCTTQSIAVGVKTDLRASSSSSGVVGMFNGAASRSAVAAVMCNPDRNQNTIQLITLPIPKFVYKDVKQTTCKKQRPGFIPSLFVGITDHYIADMVLQGTVAPMSSWEASLKQNLSLSSHCATLEQTQTENIAIIANTDKWDVKVVSSQTYILPSGSGTSGPIGMSQLVSSMLETVQAMWSAGIPAYHCMSFMESKLQEMYLHSETLAAFLLATEFCSINTVTSALNLSANDVPLLLSVASIHSPQVTKKYGVSFR